jgi:hypothetical protein
VLGTDFEAGDLAGVPFLPLGTFTTHSTYGLSVYPLAGAVSFALRKHNGAMWLARVPRRGGVWRGKE